MDDQKLILRQQLIKVLKENSNKDLYYIYAPAGYGKTTLVHQLTHLQDIDYKYVQVPINSNFTPLSFIYFLNQKINSSNPILQKEIASIDTNLEYEIDLSYFTSLLLKESLNDIVKSYLIIDDLHNMNLGIWFAELVYNILEISEHSIKPVLLSRFEPSGEFVSLLVKKNVLILNQNDLAASEKELIELATSGYELEISESQAKQIHSRFWGWITGYHFILQDIRKNGKKDFSSLEYPSMSYNFLANEVLNQMDDKTREFVIYSAMLDKFTASEVKTIFNFPKTDLIINSLRTKNIFLEIVETQQCSNRNVYKYIDLFREFLHEVIEKEISSVERKRWYIKIGEYYLKNEKPDIAVEYYIKSGKQNKLKSILKSYYRDFFDTYNYELLAKSLKLIGKDSVENDCQLLFIKGKLNYKYYHKLDLSEKYYNQALKKVKKNSLKHEIILSYLNLLLSKIKMKEVIKLVDKEIKNTRKNEYKAKLLRFQGIALHQLVQFPESIAVHIEAADLAEAADDYEELNIIRLNLARSYFMAMQRQNCLETLDLVDIKNLTLHNQFIRWKCENELFMITGYNIERFDYSFQRMREIYIDRKVQSLKRKYLDATSEYHVLGDFETATAGYKALCSLTENKSEYFNFYTFKILFDYFLRDKDACRKSQKLAEENYNEDFTYIVLGYNWSKAFPEIMDGKYRKAEKILRESIAQYLKINMPYGKLIVGQDLIRCLLLQNKPLEALKVWEEIEPISKVVEPHAFELLRILYDRDIMDFLLINKIYVPNFIYLYQQIEKMHTYVFVSDGYKERLKSLREKAIDIKLNTFGSTEIFIRGNKISHSAFHYKKWKSILIYILINYERGVDKDQIITMFFENMSPKSAENKFHQLLSNLRKLLTPKIDSDGYFKENPFSFLEYNSNKLSLRKHFNYHIDLNRILQTRNMISNKSNLSDDEISELKITLNLFKGSFMQGIYYDWVEDLRDKLSIIYDELYEELMKVLIKNYDYEEIIQFSELKIDSDPTDEKAHFNSIEAELSMQNLAKARKKKERLIKNMNKLEFITPQIEERIKLLPI